MKPAMKSSRAESPMIWTAPAERRSASASMSDVARVMSVPMGVRSKKARRWPSMWRTIRARRSNSACWPIHCVR